MSDLQSKRPIDTPLRQQKISAIKPIHSVKSTVFIFMLFTVLFGSVGGVLFQQADQVVQISKRYDDQCQKDAVCTIDIDIDQKMKRPVYVYYELKNYYQNHRRFVKSRDDKQLKGKDVHKEKLSKCDPAIEMDDMYVKTSLSGNVLDKHAPANPCGLAARALFNDTYTLFNNKSDQIEIISKDIAWQTDREHKFKRPENYQEVQWQDTEDEHFIVWMRIAASPNFRKLWGKVNQDLQGKYTLQIANNYDISEWDGEKSIVLSTASYFGGRSYFLAFFFLGAGAVCLLCAFVFALRNSLGSRVDFTDPYNLKWD